MQPMQRMAFSKSRRTSWPQMTTRPLVGLMRPTSMRMVVVFPAPFGPRKPKTSPSPIWKETSSTIVRSPMIFVRWSASRVTINCYRTFVRRFLYWYLPLLAALFAASIFGYGLVSWLRGDTGTVVDVAPRPVESQAARSKIVPLILGDSLARGTGDETGLGIGGRLVDLLKQRSVGVQRATNLAVDGARTPDLLQRLQSHNVLEVAAQSNVIIISIGGNDLWGGTDWRNAPPRDPDAVMSQVLEHITAIDKQLRGVNPLARIFIIGLYNPFVSTPNGALLTPLVQRWNARLTERFASDANVVVVPTADLFAYHDRLSPDRFHPSGEGYALIARRIADSF